MKRSQPLEFVCAHISRRECVSRVVTQMQPQRYRGFTVAFSLRAGLQPACPFVSEAS
jgi:hypothetical protein